MTANLMDARGRALSPEGRFEVLEFSRYLEGKHGKSVSVAAVARCFIECGPVGARRIAGPDSGGLSASDLAFRIAVVRDRLCFDLPNGRFLVESRRRTAAVVLS